MALFKHDMIKERGWKLITEGPVHSEALTVVQLRKVKPILKNEVAITGEELLKRAVELHVNFGQSTAEYLLEHQLELPKVWQKNLFVFPGTIWEDKDNYYGSPCLYWHAGQWGIVFVWINLKFPTFGQRVRLCR